MEKTFSQFTRAADPADFLPEAAAAKLRAIRQMVDDARAVARPVREKIEELRVERREHAARLKTLSDPRGIGGFSIDPGDVQCTTVQKHIDRLDAELIRLREVSDVRDHKSDEVAGLLQNVEAYLHEGRPRGTIFGLVETETPTLKKGETFVEAVETRRRRQREGAADKHTLECRPQPSSVARATIEAQVARLRPIGQPSLEAAIAFGDEAEFPTQTLRTEVRGETFGLGFVEARDPVALLAWLFPNELLAALYKEIDIVADDAHAIDDTTRAEKLATIAADMLAVGREEEALIVAAAASGTDIKRRSDADPRAVLQIELVTPSSASSPIVKLVEKMIG